MKKIVEVDFGIWTCEDRGYSSLQYLSDTETIRFEVKDWAEIPSHIREEFKAFVAKHSPSLSLLASRPFSPLDHYFLAPVKLRVWTKIFAPFFVREQWLTGAYPDLHVDFPDKETQRQRESKFGYDDGL